MSKNNTYKITARTESEFSDIKKRIDALPDIVRHKVISAEYSTDQHICAVMTIGWGEPRVATVPVEPLDIERTEKGIYIFYYKGYSIRTEEAIEGRICIKFFKGNA